MENIYLCIDLGGTKTAVSLYNEAYREIYHFKIETKPELGIDSLIERLKELLSTALIDKTIIKGSIASPGPLDIPNGKIVFIPTMGWKDISIVELFNKAFNTSFALLNDCTSGALGAWTMVNKPKNMLYISLSTGVGGGLILNSKLYEGNGNAAEIGHIKVSNDNKKCNCGKYGCLEIYSSGSGIQRLYYESTKLMLHPKDIAIKARSNDILSKTLFDDAGNKVNLVLKNINTLLDLDEIVIGGGLLNHRDLLEKNIVNGINTKITFLKPDDNQVLIGALEYIK